MNRRVIIVIEDDAIPTKDALEAVKIVVGMGRISRNCQQYCYHSEVSLHGRKLHISSDMTKTGDKFTVWTES